MKRIAFITPPTALHRGGGFYAGRLMAHMQPIASSFGIEFVTPDIANAVHYSYFDLFYHTLPTFLSKPSLISVLDAIPLEFPQVYQIGLRGHLNLALQKFSLSQAKLVTTLSYASVQSIHRDLGIAHAKLKLIYLASDPQYKPIAHPKNSHALPKQFVLFVGGVNYNKNLPTLISACNQINIPLVIVGREATQVESLDLSHPEHRHLQGIDWSGVIRLGFVTDQDLVAIYNLANVYCQPSFAEGFGLPVLEAMACGTPTVVSNTHSLPEIAGNAAIYFDPYSISDLTSKLQSVLSDSHLLHRLTKQGQVQAKKFSWEQTARETLQLYQSL